MQKIADIPFHAITAGLSEEEKYAHQQLSLSSTPREAIIAMHSVMDAYVKHHRFASASCLCRSLSSAVLMQHISRSI